MSKTGLVLEGGALRGIFSAGVLDVFLENKIAFPYVNGVSAGAGAALNFIAGQIGRTKKVITHENAEPYYGLSQMISSHKVLNLDKVVDEYAEKEIPFDFDTYFKSDIEQEFVVTDCETGKAVYLPEAKDKNRLFDTNKASSSVPFTCSPIEIDGHFYLDGSIVDSIPVERALTKCDKAVVVLTRKEGDRATDYSKFRLMVDLCYNKRYPLLAEALLKRAERYEHQTELIEELKNQGKIFVLRPTKKSISHFESDPQRLNEYYMHGRKIAEDNQEALKTFLGE